LTERAIEAGSDLHVDLFIVDPFAVIPTFLAMTARDAPAQRRVLARRGAGTCAITLIAFALGGSLIFKIFGITIGAFKIAGGVLIGLNALDMVQARRSQQRETPIETAKESRRTTSASCRSVCRCSRAGRDLDRHGARSRRNRPPRL